MIYRYLFLVTIFCTLAFLPGCDIIAGIFKAGFWSAIILVVLVIGLVIFGLKKFLEGN